MMRIMVLCVLWVILPVAGCANAPPGPSRPEVTVEYTVTTGEPSDADVYIRLDKRGAALVVLGQAPRRRFVFPTNPQEVERLVRNIAALADLRRQPDYYDDKDMFMSYKGLVEKPAPDWGTIIEYHGEQQSGKVRLLRNEEWRNLVWKGVIEEIETVGFLGAARAIPQHEIGERALGAGGKTAAIRWLRQALKTLRGWQDSRCSRYGAGAYEVQAWLVPPPFEDEASFRRAELGILARDKEEIDGLPDEALDWLVGHLEREWKARTSDFVVQRSDHATVISFTEDGNKFFQVAHPTVPPDLVHELLGEQPAKSGDSPGMGRGPDS